MDFLGLMLTLILKNKKLPVLIYQTIDTSKKLIPKMLSDLYN